MVDLEAWTKLASATERDVWTAQVKLTFVGTQSKPVPSLAFTTFHHMLDMSWFLPLRRPGLHYENDEFDIWNFSVSPHEMRSALTHLPRADSISETMPFVSLGVALRRSRLGECGVEVLLGPAATDATVSVIAREMDETNGLARTVLELYRSTFLQGH